MTEPTTRGRRVRAIEKSIVLLDCFWKAGRALSLHELEQQTGWAKSTIHGLLASMLDSGVVEQDATNGKYQLGYHLFELGSAVQQGWSVPEIAAPFLQNVVDQVGESAYLARLAGNELILAVCEEPHGSFRRVSEVGKRLPLHCSSQGKIILANSPKKEALRLLLQHPLVRHTPNTITDIDRFLALLPNLRSQGYAEEFEEYRLGLKSVAAPIFDANGVCRYAISVICFANATEEEYAAMRKSVIAAAAGVTQELQNAAKRR